MKIYIASAFRFKEQVMGLQSFLEGRGHEMTCQWWHKDYKEMAMRNDEWYGQPIIKTIYQRSFKAIEAADMLIIVSPHMTKFNGANVEVGMALAMRKPVVCYGELERSGMYEPVIRCPTRPHLIEVMREFEER